MSAQAKKRKWYREKIKQGCEWCGRRVPGLKSGGIEGCHMPGCTTSEGGGKQKNIFVLCKNCHAVFDNVIMSTRANSEG